MGTHSNTTRAAVAMAQTLRTIPHLASLPSSQLDVLARAAIHKTFPAKTVILDHRAISSLLIIVESGHAELVTEEGHRQKSLYRGDWYYHRGGSRRLSLRSDSRVKLALIPYNTIDNVRAAHRSRPAVRRNPIWRQLAPSGLPLLITIVVAIGLWSLILPHLSTDTRWTFDAALLPYTIGEFHVERGDTDGAIRYFERSIALDPTYAPAHLALGTLYYRDGRQNLALSHWHSAIQHDPTSAEANANLGRLLAEQSFFSNAVTYLEKAVELRPNDPDLYRSLGDVYQQQHKYVAARRAYLEVTRLDQTDANALYLVGHLYLTEDRPDEAQYYFERALAVRPSLYIAEQGLGAAYFEQERFDDARRHFERAITLAPNDAVSHFYAGLTYERLGELPASQDAFQHVLRADPSAELRNRAITHLRHTASIEGGIASMPR